MHQHCECCYWKCAFLFYCKTQDLSTRSLKSPKTLFPHANLAFSSHRENKHRKKADNVDNNNTQVGRMRKFHAAEGSRECDVTAAFAPYLWDANHHQTCDWLHTDHWLSLTCLLSMSLTSLWTCKYIVACRDTSRGLHQRISSTKGHFFTMLPVAD